MKPANSPIISTSQSLNQASSSRAAAFAMTEIKYKNHYLELIFQFQVLGGCCNQLRRCTPSEHPSQSPSNCYTDIQFNKALELQNSVSMSTVSMVIKHSCCCCFILSLFSLSVLIRL